jgi:hypothetical protein
MKRLLLLILLSAAFFSGCHTLDDMDEYGHPAKRPEVQPSNWPTENP